MSHITRLQLQITNLTALGNVAKALGGELVLGVKQFAMWGGYDRTTMRPCDHVIRFAGARYEIGVIKSGDVNNPTYSLDADFFVSGGLSEKCGMNGEKLLQGYAVETAVMQLQSEGYSVSTHTNQAGEVIVTATGASVPAGTDGGINLV